MNTENPVPEPRASYDQVFSFGARVATKVNSWGLRPEQIQSAMDQSDEA